MERLPSPIINVSSLHDAGSDKADELDDNSFLNIGDDLQCKIKLIIIFVAVDSNTDKGLEKATLKSEGALRVPEKEVKIASLFGKLFNRKK